MSHSVRRSVCVWKFCYRPPYIHVLSYWPRPCLYMSPLVCRSRVSPPQLHGALQLGEKHPRVNSEYVNLISCPNLLLVSNCVVLTFFFWIGCLHFFRQKLCRLVLMS